MRIISTLFAGLFILSISASAQSPINALSFTNSNDVVTATLPTLFGNINANDFTVECWVKPTGAQTARIFFAQLTTTNFASIMLNTSNVPYFYVYDGATNSVNAQTSLPTNQWSHLACVWKSATNSIEIYINGVLQSGATGGASSTSSNNTMTLGAKADGSQSLVGELDEVRIWSTARSECEIQSAMNGTFSSLQPNMVAYYKLDEGVAGGNNAGIITALDVSGNYNGTLSGFALTGGTSNWVASSAGISVLNPASGLITATDVQTSCGPFVWMDGNTYSSSNNTATYTVAGSGCDTLYTLDLTVASPTTGIDVQSACGSYTWIDGNTYTSSNTTATHILPNAAGCDSTVTLNLTIHQEEFGTDDQVSCGPYTWINGLTYTTSGSATYTIVGGSVYGCDSTVTLNLTIPTLDNTVTNNSPTLTANAAFAAYQWIDCDNGNAPINGETAQVFTASSNGNYAVIVTELGCSDTSACQTVANVGLQEEIFASLNVYPNPNNTGKLYVSFDGIIESIVMIDAQGRKMNVALDTKSNSIDVSRLNQGIYMLQFKTNQGWCSRSISIVN